MENERWASQVSRLQQEGGHGASCSPREAQSELGLPRVIANPKPHKVASLALIAQGFRRPTHRVSQIGLTSNRSKKDWLPFVTCPKTTRGYLNHLDWWPVQLLPADS